MMDREILFRGKQIKDGKWVYGTSPLEAVAPSSRNLTIMYGVKNKDTLEVYDVDPNTVGQYTGLTDKNGVKVFEGDVATDSKCVVEIVWSKNHCWSCKVIKGGALSKGLTFPLWQWDDCSQNANRQLEVIGSIHEQEAQNEANI